MKPLISMIVAIMFTLSSAAYAETVTTVTTKTVTTKTTCGCKKHKTYKNTCNYFKQGYCEHRGRCGEEVVCYAPHCYQCRTELSYHHGRNSATVQVCN